MYLTPTPSGHTYQSSYTACKCCLIGDSQVGKTSLCIKLTQEDTYDVQNTPSATIGYGYYSTWINSNFSKGFLVTFWDTAGQEKYRALAPIYLHGSDFVIVMESKEHSQQSILDRFEYYTNFIHDCMSYKEEYHIIYILNKTDLQNNDLDTQSLINELHPKTLFTTSATTGEGCDELKEYIYQKYTEIQSEKLLKEISSKQPQNKNNTCGC